jgi:hypothetical protein
MISALANGALGGPGQKGNGTPSGGTTESCKMRGGRSTAGGKSGGGAITHDPLPTANPAQLNPAAARQVDRNHERIGSKGIEAPR